MTLLTHYTANPMCGDNLDLIQRTIDRGPLARDDYFKPKGLWVSVDGPDDWKSWCEGEEFRLEQLKYAYRVTLRETARVLYIKTPEEIDEFTLKHGFSLTASRYVHSIRWGDLKKDYDAIIIAPYQWSRRLSNHCFWYYPWDCASGCIWNMSIIETFELKEGYPKEDNA